MKHSSLFSKEGKLKRNLPNTKIRIRKIGKYYICKYLYNNSLQYEI